MSRQHPRTTRLCIYLSLLLPTIAALCWLWFAVPTQAATRSQDAAPARDPTSLLIGIAPDAPPAKVVALLAREGLRVERAWPALHLVQARLVAPAAATQALDATAAAQANLAASPLLRYVTYDIQIELAALPTDPRADEQWALAATKVVQGWNISRGDERVVIALLDTGFAMNHEDLPHERLWVNETEANGTTGIDDDGNGLVDDINGWDWIDDDPIADDQHGHGTHVAGVIAAGTNNGIGIAGHGQQLRVAPLRVLDSSGTGFISDLVAALDYARAQRFPIINLSLTVQVDSPALHDAIQAAHAAGSMVVAATGNRGGGVQWPALYPETVAVAATSSDGDRWVFSNYGPAVDIAAPGAAILSTYIDRPVCATPCAAYSSQTGTSMATPHVSALAGLILSLRPDFTLTDTLTLIKASAVDLNASAYPGTDIYLGAGAIDYHAALQAASAPLALSSPLISPAVVQTGAPIPIPIHVALHQNGSQWDIAGAVISYSLTPNNGEPVSAPATTVTDHSGTAILSVTAPSQEGTYLLHSAVGAASHTMSLTARNLPVTTTLTVTTLTTTVGGPAVPFTVMVDDPEGMIGTSELPLRLTTSLGTFEDGRAEKIVYLSSTVYTDKLLPGTVAGSATLLAGVGAVRESVSITVLPGEPAKLGSPLDDEPPLFIASEETPLSFVVTDVYGNAVADQTRVVFSTTVGTVDPVEATTVRGVVTTKLMIPHNAPGPVVITVTVPNTDLIYRLEIPLIQNSYLPLLYITQRPDS